MPTAQQVAKQQTQQAIRELSAACDSPNLSPELLMAAQDNIANALSALRDAALVALVPDSLAVQNAARSVC